MSDIKIQMVGCNGIAANVFGVQNPYEGEEFKIRSSVGTSPAEVVVDLTANETHISLTTIPSLITSSATGHCLDVLSSEDGIALDDVEILEDSVVDFKWVEGTLPIKNYAAMEGLVE